jgi:hypothetical protein
MELTKIADSNCKDGDCPTVYRTDRGLSGCKATYWTGLRQTVRLW